MHTPMDNMIYSPSMNLVDAVVDEVALEGLDGITLEALWQRMAIRLQIPHPLSRSLMEQIWSICTATKDLIFYELEADRPPLIIYDRYEFVDPDLGVILEPDVVPEDIYEHVPIDDTKNGVRGSCKSYHTRKLIDSIRELTLGAAEERYGQRLVILGSQATRQNALTGDTVCPTLELTVIQYCFLERVGRSRYHGEVTQGKRSLAMLKEDPKSLFYHRKYLTKHKLITKQLHHQKSSGHGTSGSLLHLPRFFVERKPKMIYLAERIIEILKRRENCLADYVEIKKELQIERTIKKLCKAAFFQRVVKTDLLVPYRMLYPNADASEWQRKGDDKEKRIRAVQLIDPNMDMNELWNKEELLDDEESYEIDISRQKVNEPFLRQANVFVEASNYDGLSQTELVEKMGVTKLQSRTIFRNLARLDIVATYMNDMGRQRITKYVSRRFEKNSRISKQFQTEMSKMKEHTRTSSLEVASVSSTQDFFNPPDDVKSPVVEEPMEEDLELPQAPQASKSELNVLFSAVNHSLKKYKLNASRQRYQVTHQNLSEMDVRTLRVRTRKLYDQIKKNSLPSSKSEDTDRVEADACDIELQEAAILNNTGGLRSLLGELDTSDSKNTGNITYRILRRANMIIESVKEHKVIDDMTKLMRMINEEEEREGYDVKIDKKSLVRLLQKLSMDNLVKNIKLILSSKGKKKCLTFICDPSINVNHTVIQSAVEQARIKFCLMRPARTKRPHSPEPGSDKSSPRKSKKRLKLELDPLIMPLNLKYDPKAGKRYGYRPKFVRMQIIHLLLYYIVYDHPGPSTVSRGQQIQRLRARGFQIDDEMEREMGEIYNTQVGWKMFIPPLPIHTGWPEGWALVCDILLRIPLSIFLKIYKVPFNLLDLDHYTEHPIRKHFLIKDLPAPLRNALLVKRRYIFSIHETITRLCYIGLIQFGPQKLKEKDQVFIYLNRRSELMDTTTSAAGYHKIEEKSYPICKYCFDKIQVVEKYWYDMWNICINTHLGGRLAVQGTDIILEDLSKKTDMIETLRARVPKEAESLDLGYMPGDRKGAAGIDSAFFAHLKRNWNWDNFQNTYNTPSDYDRTSLSGERSTRLSKIEAKPIRFTELPGLKKVCGPTHVDANELKVSRDKRLTLLGVSDKILRHKLLASKINKKQNTIVRRVLPRKKKSRSRVKYDDIDYSALQKMEKLRVDWDPREDNILLVCKVVMMYLCPNPRRQLITFTAVRDVLRSYSTSSHNKTSRACQRRLLYMLKQPQTMHSVGLGVEEIRQNYYVNKRYGDIVDKIRRQGDPGGYDEKIAEVFKSLVAYVAKKYYDISQADSKEDIPTPSTVQEFNLFYGITHPQKPQGHLGFRHDVRSVNDIHTATINSVIYSSMCCGRDRRSWAYQLFRIYQQYSELLLRNAMGKIRADQMVSIKKHYLNALKKFGNCLPMSSSQYQLSTSYHYKFQTKVPPEVFTEVFDFLMSIMKGYQDDLGSSNAVKVLPPTGGMVAGIPDYLLDERMDFNVEIPDHIIALDPKLQEYDETYIRIAKRYQDILLSLEQEDIMPEASMCPKVPGRHTPVELKEEPEESRDTDKPEVEKSKPEVDSLTSKVKRLGPMKNHWTQTLVRRVISCEDPGKEELRLDEPDLEDDDAFVRLQDGTIISITSEDIEAAKAAPVDDTLHQAFLGTRTEEIEDFPAFSAIGELKRMAEEPRPMPVKVPQEQRGPRKPKEETDMPDDVVPPQPPKSAAAKDSNFINDIIANADGELESKEAFNQKDRDSSDTKRRYTRIALLKMREELNEDLPDSHHAHEYFVVNTFGIFYSLPALQAQKEANPTFDIVSMRPSELLMLDEEVYKKVLGDIRKFAVFPRRPPDYPKLRRQLEERDGIREEDTDVVYEYVGSRREQGATLRELALRFYPKLQKALYDILFLLTEHRAFLRSGVTEAHYVHHNFIDPWLIQSIRIMRLQKEALPLVPPGTVYVLETDNAETKRSSEGEKSDSGEKNPEDGPSTSASEQQKSLQKKRTCLLQTSEIYSAAKKLDMNSAEDINVVVRPWIQIDGLINRKTLEQMLGSVLGHCVMNPGIFLSKVQERYIPALQPYHTRELVEVLIKLGCLEVKVLQKGTTNLFSKSTSIRLNYPVRSHGESEYDNEIILEPTIGALVRFSTFMRKNHDQLQ